MVTHEVWALKHLVPHLGSLADTTVSGPSAELASWWLPAAPSVGFHVPGGFNCLVLPPQLWLYSHSFVYFVVRMLAGTLTVPHTVWPSRLSWKSWKPLQPVDFCILHSCKSCILQMVPRSAVPKWAVPKIPTVTAVAASVYLDSWILGNKITRKQLSWWPDVSTNQTP